MKWVYSVGQKKYDRPIAITDIAINKVPATHLAGFSNSQNKYIQEKHKQLLKIAQQLCHTYETNLMEVVILIDTHTWEEWIVCGKTGCTVDIEADGRQSDGSNPAYQALLTRPKNSLLLMHNHPGTGTFSGTDFKTFCNNESLYIMTVVGNNGSIYVMKKEFGFRSDVALTAYGNLSAQYKKYRNNGTKAIHRILKNATNYNMSYKKGRKKL